MTQPKQDTLVTARFELAQVDQNNNLLVPNVERIYHFVVNEAEAKAIYLLSELLQRQAETRRAVEIKLEHDSSNPVEMMLCDQPWKIKVAGWEVIKREPLTHKV